MIEPEIQQKIIQMRLDGVTWREIKEKFNLSPNAQTGIYKAKWFLNGMKAAKEKRRKAVQRPILSSEQKRKKDTKDSQEATDKGEKQERKTVDEELEKHIGSSDKAPPDIKKGNKVQSGTSKDTKEKKEEKKEKSSFGLWAILIIALVIGVVMIILLLKGKKAQTKEPEEQKPKSTGFEGRSEEDL